MFFIVQNEKKNHTGLIFNVINKWRYCTYIPALTTLSTLTLGFSTFKKGNTELIYALL